MASAYYTGQHIYRHFKPEMNQWERLLHIQARLKRKLLKYEWNAK